MGLEIKNAEVIVKLVKEKLEAAKKRLGPALEDEVTRMIQRTRSGVDVDGRPFTKYTQAYNRFKGSFSSGFITRHRDSKNGGYKKGKNAKQVKGDYSVTQQPVDLTLSGSMLASIQVEVRDTPEGVTGTVFFNSASEAAKAQGNQQKRRFFGFSNEQVQRIRDRLVGK